VMAVMHRIRLDHLQTFFCKFTDVGKSPTPEPNT
jgi:hypothetical protein